MTEHEQLELCLDVLQLIKQGFFKDYESAGKAAENVLTAINLIREVSM